MQNRKGFIGIIAILIVVVIAALWMGYLLRNNWLEAGNINLSKDLPGGNNDAAVQPKGINGQLDDLRQNVKNIQDSKNKEINDALNDSGQHK